MATLTKGDVIVEDIKIGDIQYEYEYNVGIKSVVIELPVRSEDGYWTWKNKNFYNEEHIITYGVREGMSHYGPNLYTSETYTVKHWVGKDSKNYKYKEVTPEIIQEIIDKMNLKR